MFSAIPAAHQSDNARRPSTKASSCGQCNATTGVFRRFSGSGVLQRVVTETHKQNRKTRRKRKAWYILRAACRCYNIQTALPAPGSETSSTKAPEASRKEGLQRHCSCPQRRHSSGMLTESAQLLSKLELSPYKIIGSTVKAVRTLKIACRTFSV